MDIPQGWDTAPEAAGLLSEVTSDPYCQYTADSVVHLWGEARYAEEQVASAGREERRSQALLVMESILAVDDPVRLVDRGIRIAQVALENQIVRVDHIDLVFLRYYIALQGCNVRRQVEWDMAALEEEEEECSASWEGPRHKAAEVN